MNSHGHDERLSAFYDGELPAVERAEVERLLTERPELRAELAGMTDLSQRLTELADDGIDFDLRAGVMEAIRARAGREPEAENDRSLGATAPVAEAATLTPSPGGRGELNGTSGHPPSAISHPPLTNDQRPSTKAPITQRRWMPLVLMTCSLALLVAAILPLTMKPDQLLVATSDTPHSMAPVAAATAATDGVFEQVDAGAENGPSVAMQAAAPAESDIVGGFGGAVAAKESPSQLLQSLADKGRLNPGELITQLIEIGGQAMLAEYQVVDVRRSFSQVEVLLKDNGIVPLDSAVERGEVDSADTKNSPVEMQVIVVEAESTPLNVALDQFDAFPENEVVMVANLDSTTLQEAQDPGPLKDALAKAGDLPLPAPAAAPMAEAAGASQPDVRASKMAPRSAMPEKLMTEKMKPDMKSAAPAGAVLPKSLANAGAPSASKKHESLDAAEPPVVMGNSIVLRNADEVYPALEVAARNSYNSYQNTPNQVAGVNRRAGSRAAVQDLVQQPASPVDVFSQNGQNPSRTPDLQYNQRSMNRMRQLAILVLRPKPMAEPGSKAP